MTNSNYSFSPSMNAFYENSLRETFYEIKNAWPADAVEVSDEIAATFMTVTPPTGKMLGAVEGQPVWTDIPPLTQEQLIVAADVEKQTRIDAANAYMNGKQWPGKAAMGRLTDAEKTQYNAWLDYLDALELVDTSGAPDIEWPTPPAVQAR
ncbi:tail fiber assembly protein [Escherichia coli]|uniref:tail fiber assembly protein n=1 Tax=Escherichia coli TaxID=562 RepID=UPI00406A5354